MRDVAVRLDDLQCTPAAVTGVGAQVLAAPGPGVLLHTPADWGWAARGTATCRPHDGKKSTGQVTTIRAFDFGAKDVEQMVVTWPVDFLPS